MMFLWLYEAKKPFHFGKVFIILKYCLGGVDALFYVPKPDRSEHGVQRSKAESRGKTSYEMQALLFKKKE